MQYERSTTSGYSNINNRCGALGDMVWQKGEQMSYQSQSRCPFCKHIPINIEEERSLHESNYHVCESADWEMMARTNEMALTRHLAMQLMVQARLNPATGRKFYIAEPN